MSKEKQIEYLDKDFLGNKVNIGDKVIFQAPDYRMFTIGTVITKANKSCQIEYLNTWNFPSEGRKLICRQGYDQIIKQNEGDWKIRKIGDGGTTRTCSNCNISQTVNVYNGKVMFKYCPYCGAKMKGEAK